MVQRRRSRQPRLQRSTCEICSRSSGKIHIHHIIPRCDELRTSQDNWNLASLCPNCHTDVHDGKVTIIGVYHGTGGRVLKFYYGDSPPEGFLEREYWHIKPEDNPMVVYRGKDNVP